MADREDEADPSRGIAKAIGLVVSLRTLDQHEIRPLLDTIEDDAVCRRV